MNVLGTALSGLLANSRSIATSANNIANLRSDGFQAERTVLTSAENGGVQTSQVAAGNPNGDISLGGISNVSLSDEAINIIQSEAGFRANLAVIETQDELSGTLLDILA